MLRSRDPEDETLSVASTYHPLGSCYLLSEVFEEPVSVEFRVLWSYGYTIETARVIARTLLTLTPRERYVIEQRFGLKSRSGMTQTLREIGEKYGVTRERVRQIEAKALRKLRHPSRSRMLRKVFSPQRPSEEDA